MSRSWGEIALLRASLACWVVGGGGALVCGCQSEPEQPSESAKEITAFVIEEQVNPGLDGDLRGSISGRLISLRAPFGTRVKALRPTITYTGYHLSPESGEPQDFTNPVEYIVTGADGSVRVYTATLTILPPSTSKDITGFQIAGVDAQIDGPNIALTLPYGTDRSALRGFVHHTGVSVKPASGSTQDFNAPVDYVVTARDGSTKTYTATVNLAPSNAKDITQFKIGDTSAEISANEITLTLPYGTDLSALAPAISFTGASVRPESGSPTDFRDPVLYTVTAADGSTRVYSVEIELAVDSAKDITAFSILGVNGTINGSTITVALPIGTDLTQLVPSVTHTGQNLSPPNGVAQDFTSPVSYRVAAADGSSKDYRVSVVLGSGSGNEITSFSIAGCEAQIVGNAISLTLPFGATLNGLTPDIEHSGASITPASGTPQDFTSPIEYTVTAADGSTRSYTVTLHVSPSTAREVTSFMILGVSGVITGHTISLTLPYGTDVHSLQPILEHTGSSIDPNNGQTRDFSEPVVYTVTAADRTSRQYVVTVHVAPSMAKEITRFAILGMNARIDANTITLALPFGTQLDGLAPVIEHDGARIEPASGVPQNFSGPVAYTVSAADGSTRVYTVQLSVAADSAKDITAFSLAGVNADVGANSIALTLPYGTPIDALSPTIAITGQRLSPPSGMPQDFRQPITYTVTAQDGTTKSYTVSVQVAPNTAKEILGFSVLGISGSIGGDAIILTVPYGSELSAVTPLITINGTNIQPASGAVVDLREPQSYRVTAEDGSTRQYTVSANMSPPPDCAAIKRFRIESTSGVYTLDPDAGGSLPPFTAYCDMARDGGGWTLIGKVGSGNFSALSDDQYLALIANPIADVNVSLLQVETPPVPGQIAFYDRTKTNALYNHSGMLRAVRIDVSDNQLDFNANGVYFQQRVNAPPDWDFWAAMRNALLWNRDGSTTAPGGDYVAYFGVDFVFSPMASDFDPQANVVHHRGDSQFGAFGTWTHVLLDSSYLTVSRRFGLLGGYNSISGLWLLTANPTDGAWKNDPSFQCTVIWLR